MPASAAAPAVLEAAFAAACAARPDQAELLTESCRQAFGQEPAMDCFIGGVIAINAGPNLVGLIYRKK